MDTLSARIRTARERHGWTQAELGQRADMAAAAVSHFENGVRQPSLESLVRLADALDVSTDELLGRLTHAADRVDPVFLRAAQSDVTTYDMVKRITEALLLADQEKQAASNIPKASSVSMRTL